MTGGYLFDSKRFDGLLYSEEEIYQIFDEIGEKSPFGKGARSFDPVQSPLQRRKAVSESRKRGTRG
jgi:hypothetical protein